MGFFLRGSFSRLMGESSVSRFAHGRRERRDTEKKVKKIDIKRGEETFGDRGLQRDIKLRKDNFHLSLHRGGKESLTARRKRARNQGKGNAANGDVLGHG